MDSAKEADIHTHTHKHTHTHTALHTHTESQSEPIEQAHLVSHSPLSHTSPFMEDATLGYGDDSKNATIPPWCPLGNIIQVTSSPRPRDPVTDVRVVGLSEHSVRLTWHPGAPLYRLSIRV